jgi:hypothetical protein
MGGPIPSGGIGDGAAAIGAAIGPWSADAAYAAAPPSCEAAGPSYPAALTRYAAALSPEGASASEAKDSPPSISAGCSSSQPPELDPTAQGGVEPGAGASPGDGEPAAGPWDAEAASAWLRGMRQE